MKVGLVSDVHGNRVALEAVLEDMPEVDALACAGDVVGYNPWPSDCIEILRGRSVPTVLGNHDHALIEGGAFHFNDLARAGLEHAEWDVGAEGREWLESLPMERREFDDRVKLVHGHPDDPFRYTRPNEVGPGLLGEERVLVFGHTHHQHVDRFEEGLVVNPGSVGQPRDGDSRAAYAVLDLADLSVELHRVAYDIERVTRALATFDLPAALGERLERGR